MNTYTALIIVINDDRGYIESVSREVDKLNFRRLASHPRLVIVKIRPSHCKVRFTLLIVIIADFTTKIIEH